MAKKKDRYRRFPLITDITGMKSTFDILKPDQPRLNRALHSRTDKSHFDEKWFAAALREKIRTHPDNAKDFPFTGERIFDEPLVGFARGDDPIFKEYKGVIGSFHLTPQEIMRWQAEQNGVEPPGAADISVVSYILPIIKETKRDNARREEWLSERWAQTRRAGEMFSRTVAGEIVAELMGDGILAVAPDSAPFFGKKKYPGPGWASPWSHRHMAYAAGLGTFGVHDFLITEKGAAHRCGSFVVALKLSPDRKRPDDIHAHCLFHQNGTCLECAKKCPVQAISEKGHDKDLCYGRVAKSLKYCIRNYHTFIIGCGLCSTGVPCESAIPKGALKNDILS